jgi:hypothetical protein
MSGRYAVGRGRNVYPHLDGWQAALSLPPGQCGVLVVKHDRHRAVVDDLQAHTRTEHAGLDVDAVIR